MKMDCIQWDHCPKQTQNQIEHLVAEFRHQLDENLIGVYLHGSLATGCFNPAQSDIDLLVVLHQRLSQKQKKRLIETLLQVSKAPHPIEISFLRFDDLHPWRHPTPFELHYSEDWRQKYTNDLSSNNWRHWPVAEQTDADLAAHITVTKARGVCLWGGPILQTFPDVPSQDFADSIASDFIWAQNRLNEYPVYGVLNACRIYAFFAAGRIFSKTEGAEWAMEKMPAQFRKLIASALAAYRSPNRVASLPEGTETQLFFDYVATVIAR